MKYHKFNEDTRVKLPATLQFLKIGYNYLSLNDAEIDFNTKIYTQMLHTFVNQKATNITEVKRQNKLLKDRDTDYELTKIALVPIGYGDGLLRVFSGTYVHINGKRCKIVGNICMDMCFVDISEASASVGDEVIFLNDLAEISNKTRLTKYEILTGFNRLRPGE